MYSCIPFFSVMSRFNPVEQENDTVHLLSSMSRHRRSHSLDARKASVGLATGGHAEASSLLGTL